MREKIKVVMKKNILSISRRLGAACLLTLSTSITAADSSAIRVPLVNTGVDSNAVGTATMAFGSRSSSVLVRAANLTPGQDYTLYVGVIPEATAVADANGRWSARFRTRPTSSSQLLDFDPRGLVMALHDGNTNVLAALISRTGEPLGCVVSEKAEYEDDDSKTTLSFKTLKNGRRSFTARMTGVSGSNWVIYCNGQAVGDLIVRGRTGSARFDTAPTSTSVQTLDFDPRGLVVDISRDDDLHFTGECEAQIRNVNVALPSIQFASIPTTGLDEDATAKAKLRVDDDARRKFSVEVEDIGTGDYEFVANGIVQGNIHVVNSDSGTRGEIEFSSRDDDDDELPLTFDPTNSTFIIRQGSYVYFEGMLVLPNSGGTNEPPTEIEEEMASTGLDGDASGDARYRIRDDGRRDFNVEIEDVPVGSYQLFIGGVKRGTISVVSLISGVEGELEFSTPAESGKLPLNFDPRGQLIEIRNANGTYFEHLFGGGGSVGGSNLLVVPFEIELAFFNISSHSNATAKAEFDLDDDGDRSFEVEIEDAPLGTYTLWVGGTNVASFNVVASDDGTHGEIEFDSDSPEDGELLLNFDPLGKLIEIKRDDVVHFAREFTASN